MNQDSRTKNSIRNILTGTLGQMIQLIMSFVCRMVFVRYFSAAYVGVNGLFVDILSMLSLAELGVGSAIVFELYGALARKNTEELKSLMLMYRKAYVTIGICIAGVSIAISPFLSLLVKDSGQIVENFYLIYGLYVFNTVITYFYSYKSSLLIADQKNYIVSIVRYSVLALQNVLQILIIIYRKDFILYLVAQALFTLIFNVIVSKITNHQYKFIKEKEVAPLDIERKKGLFTNVKALIVTKLSAALVNSTDNIIITAICGLVDTGLTSNYNMLTSAATVVLGQTVNAVSASIGNLNAGGDDAKKELVLEVASLCSFWLFGCVAIGFVAVSRDFVALVFGDTYVLQMLIVIAMAINFYTQGMQEIIYAYRNTMGLFRYGKFCNLITGILNILLSVLLGKTFGVFGILIATFISRLLTNIWYFPYSVYHYGFNKSVKPYYIRYGMYMLVLFLSGTLAVYLCSFVHADLWVSIVVKAVICIAVSNVCFYIAFGKMAAFSYLKDKLLSLLNR